MQLPDFIARALNFFSKAETHFEAESKLAQSQARIVELEADAKIVAETLASRDATIKDLESKLELQAVKITSLEAELAAEKAKVTETLAGLGVQPSNIPAAADAPPGAVQDIEKELTEKVKAITDPVERTVFFRKNKERILAASRGQRK